MKMPADASLERGRARAAAHFEAPRSMSRVVQGYELGAKLGSGLQVSHS